MKVYMLGLLPIMHLIRLAVIRYKQQGLLNSEGLLHRFNFLSSLFVRLHRKLLMCDFVFRWHLCQVRLCLLSSRVPYPMEVLHTKSTVTASSTMDRLNFLGAERERERESICLLSVTQEKRNFFNPLLVFNKLKFNFL